MSAFDDLIPSEGLYAEQGPPDLRPIRPMIIEASQAEDESIFAIVLSYLVKQK